MRVNQVYIGPLRHFAERHYAEEIASFKGIPNVDYHLFSSDEIAELLTNNYGEETLNSFNSLLPPAYKADLARLAVVDTYGGWYSDLGNQVADGDKMLELSNNDLVLFDETTEPRLRAQQGNIPAIQNGCFYSKANSPFLQAAIEGINKKVSEKYYGVSPWDITGPTHVGQLAYSKDFKAPNIGYFEGTNIAEEQAHPSYRYAYTWVDDVKVVWFKNPSKQSMFKHHSTDYFQMWDRQEVYI